MISGPSVSPAFTCAYTPPPVANALHGPHHPSVSDLNLHNVHNCIGLRFALTAKQQTTYSSKYRRRKNCGYARIAPPMNWRLPPAN